jgi:hypothetical protein
MWLESFMIFLVALWELWTTLSLAMWEILKAATPFVVLGGKALAERLNWRVAISLLLATQLVRLLPGLEGAVEAGVEAQIEALRDPAPLYVIMIPITRLSKLLVSQFWGLLLTESSHSIGFRLSWCRVPICAYLYITAVGVMMKCSRVEPAFENSSVRDWTRHDWMDLPFNTGA